MKARTVLQLSGQKQLSVNFFIIWFGKISLMNSEACCTKLAEQTLSFRVGLEFQSLWLTLKLVPLKVWHLRQTANHTKHGEHQFDSLLVRETVNSRLFWGLRGRYKKYNEIKHIYKAGINTAAAVKVWEGSWKKISDNINACESKK